MRINQNVIINASRDLFLAFNKAKMFFMAWQNFFIMNSLHKPNYDMICIRCRLEYYMNNKK